MIDREFIGGVQHVLENLQYLTAHENRQKSANWIGIEDGEGYDPNFLLKRLEKELEENVIDFVIINK